MAGGCAASDRPRRLPVPTAAVMREVATWRPLDEQEKAELAILLRPMAIALRDIRLQKARAAKARREAA